MKKFVWVPFILAVATTLLGCQNTEGIQGKKAIKNEPITKAENLRPKIIIRHSVNDPLPPEAKNAQAMQEKAGPQPIPNVKLDEPVIITLMPFSANKKPTVKGTPIESNPSTKEKSKGTPPDLKAREAQENSAGKMGMKATARAKAQFPNIFGGLALSKNMSHINIYLTRITPEIKRTARGSIPAGKISFHKIPHSWKQMLAIHHKVKHASDKLRSEGIRVSGFGPDIKTGKEKIYVVHLTSEEKEKLFQQFGKANIEVKNRKPSEIPVAYAGTAKRESERR